MLDRTPFIAQIRHFNRFYTRTLGLLNHTLTNSAFTLAEARVLFEIGHFNSPDRRSRGENGVSASDIAAQLHLDAAYLARILKKLAAGKLVASRPDEGDGRRRILSLTAQGSTALQALQSAANSDIGDVLSDVSDGDVLELGEALRRAARMLGDQDAPAAPLRLRPHEIGDVGWVIERQARLYADEYGWNQEYEALVCEIGAAFLRNFVPGKEFCWIAERAGQRLGAVFLVRRSDEEAQLRMLHVERAARGQGIGGMLVETCLDAARRAGYRRMMLWTNDILAGARRIYERAGFRLVTQEGHRSFGHDLHGQTWEITL